MTITRAYQQKWLAAIDRCLEQSEYGGAEDCQLCIENMDCEECIVPAFTGGPWCAEFLNIRHGRMKPMDRWEPDNVRPVLLEMRAWLMDQEVVG